jgi:hypothetical protein
MRIFDEVLGNRAKVSELPDHSRDLGVRTVEGR